MVAIIVGGLTVVFVVLAAREVYPLTDPRPVRLRGWIFTITAAVLSLVWMMMGW